MMSDDLAGLSPRLRTTTDIVWPAESHRRDVARSKVLAASGRFLVLPSRRRPRVLVPTPPALAAAGLLHSSTGSGPVAAGLRRLGASVLRSGVHRRLPLDQLVVSLRQDALPSADLTAWVAQKGGPRARIMAVRLGRPRPNQKPIVLLGDSECRPVAFAKLGSNELTDGLVAHEASVLSTGLPELRPGSGIQAPRVLAAGVWNGHHVVVLEALDLTGQGAELRPDLLAATMTRIAGPRRTVTVSTWAERVVLPRLAAHPNDEAAERAAVPIRRLRDQDGELEMEVGRWHGDFRPWNLGRTRSGDVAVWDWERSARDCFVGLDAVHYHFPVPRPDRDREWHRGLAEKAADRSGGLLEAMGISGRRVTVLRAAHLVELVLREFDDTAREPAVARPDHLETLLDLLEDVA